MCFSLTWVGVQVCGHELDSSPRNGGPLPLPTEVLIEVGTGTSKVHFSGPRLSS